MSRFQELCGFFFFLHILHPCFKRGCRVFSNVFLDIFGQNGKAFPCFLDINSEKDHENGKKNWRGDFRTNIRYAGRMLSNFMCILNMLKMTSLMGGYVGL